MRAYLDTGQWIVVRLRQRLFAVPSEMVMEMLAMPEVSAIPHLPLHVRGVMNLRGRVMPLIDLRMRLGVESSNRELERLVETMQAREEDHRKWVGELENCVRERRDFGLTTDPHRCAFGRWYDTYAAPSPLLAAVLRKFDAPHGRIHAAGREVMNLMAGGRWDEAARCAGRIRGSDFAYMIRLFDELRGAILESYRETAVVLDAGAQVIAVSVDGVESVECLKPGTIEPAPVSAEDGDELVCAVARRLKNDEIVMLLDPARVLEPAEPSSV